MGLGIVDAGDPDLPAAVTGGVEILPGFESGISLLMRRGVPDPLTLAAFGVEGLEEAGRIEIVAGSDEDMVADDDRRHGGEVLLVKIGDGHVPALFASAGVERN